MVQRAKDLLLSLLRRRCDPWPWNFHKPWDRNQVKFIFPLPAVKAVLGIQQVLKSSAEEEKGKKIYKKQNFQGRGMTASPYPTRVKLHMPWVQPKKNKVIKLKIPSVGEDAEGEFSHTPATDVKGSCSLGKPGSFLQDKTYIYNITYNNSISGHFNLRNDNMELPSWLSG